VCSFSKCVIWNGGSKALNSRGSILKKCITMYPKRHPAVTLEKDNNGFVLSHRETGEKKKINEIGAVLWILCDGNHSCEDMVVYIRKTCTHVPETVEDEVYSFIQALEKAGFLEKDLHV